MKLSIVICAYNEVKTIDKLIKKVCEVELINDFEKEILIFDNNSDDGTKDILNKYSNLDNIKIFYNETNIGKGGSIIKSQKKSFGKLKKKLT